LTGVAERHRVPGAVEVVDRLELYKLIVKGCQ
jgi:hypothetical protein